MLTLEHGIVESGDGCGPTSGGPPDSRIGHHGIQPAVLVNRALDEMLDRLVIGYVALLEVTAQLRSRLAASFF